jgi:two-component system response regulator PilR (NtrC family)
VIELAVPPLRERREDITPLAEAVLQRLSDELGEIAPTLTDDARESLEQYPFPGNVRELENVLERALALSDGELITAADLHLPASRPAAAPGNARITAPQPATPAAPTSGNAGTAALPDYIEQLEREAIIKTLEECRYNKTKAAAKLGITFRAMRYKLKKLGIE